MDRDKRHHHEDDLVDPPTLTAHDNYLLNNPSILPYTLEHLVEEFAITMSQSSRKRFSPRSLQLDVGEADVEEATPSILGALHDPLLQRPAAGDSYGRSKNEDATLRQNLLPHFSSSTPPQHESLQPHGTLTRRRTASTNGGSTQDIRLLDRDAAFMQSRGRWKVQHVSRDAARHQHLDSGGRRRLPHYKLLWDSWFYTLAYQKTWVIMSTLFVTYTAIVFAFAFLYWGVSVLGEKITKNPDGSETIQPFCSMDIHNHMEALYFSLSTMTTIGYGVSDYYFGGCWTPLLLVLAQVCSAITFDAVAIGLLFQRLSRGHKRAKTILFSGKAVIRRVQGQLYLFFRVGELRQHFWWIVRSEPT